jgi:hypothetical protein
MPCVVYNTNQLQDIGEAEFGISNLLAGMWTIEHWLKADRNYQYQLIMHDFAVEFVLESDAEAVELKLRFS